MPRQTTMHQPLEGRTISLVDDGIACVPMMGYNHYLHVSRCESFHTHAGCVELIVCLRGNCVYHTPNGEHALMAGGVVAWRPDEPHVLKVYHKGLRMYWLRFRLPQRGELVLDLPKRESDWIADQMMHLPLRVFRGSARLQRAFIRLFRAYDEAPARAVERSVRLKADVLEIIMATLEASSARPNSPRQRVISEVADEMRKHPERRYALDMLAARAEMSVSGLMAAFKRQTGFSPHAFHLSCRIDLAKRLLSEGKPVMYVADAVGFRSAKRLATCFRQFEGRSPRDWVKSRK